MTKEKVFECINDVQAGLAKVGISKAQYNPMQKFNFRGIDAVYNTLAPLLAEHRLCIIPNIVSRKMYERQSKMGGNIFYVILKVEYTFIAVEDGSKFSCVVLGEAMDSGDKATSKAMSCAYKNLVLQIFCVPTEGDNDPDAQSHQVAQAPVAPPADPAWMKLNDLVFDLDISNEQFSSVLASNGYAGINIKDLPDTAIEKIINDLKGK